MLTSSCAWAAILKLHRQDDGAVPGAPYVILSTSLGLAPDPYVRFVYDPRSTIEGLS